MGGTNTNIYVYADWIEFSQPTLVDILTAHQAKACKAFSFEYGKQWLKTNEQRLIDSDIPFYSGQQFPNNKEDFGILLDSMPYT